MQCRYREKLVEAGDMIFGTVYAEYRKAGKRRGPFRETSEVQARNNERRSLEYHRWLLHMNFTRKDYFLTLTFDNENLPTTKADLDREIRNYISRVKRIYRRSGIELRYVTIRTDGEGVRPHCHIYLTGGVDRDLLELAWGRGYCNVKRVQFNECGISDLAVYTGAQKSGAGEGRPRRRKGEKRWSGSRNLIKPAERTNVTRYSKKAVEEIADAGNPQEIFAKRYRGYWLAEFPVMVQNPVTHGWWMSFVLYKPFSENLEPYVRARNTKKYSVGEDGAIEEVYRGGMRFAEV